MLRGEKHPLPQPSTPPNPEMAAAKSTWRIFMKPRSLSEKELPGKNIPDGTEEFTKQCRIRPNTSWAFFFFKGPKTLDFFFPAQFQKLKYSVNNREDTRACYASGFCKTPSELNAGKCWPRSRGKRACHTRGSFLCSSF